jgi:hypothetical protein
LKRYSTLLNFFFLSHAGWGLSDIAYQHWAADKTQLCDSGVGALVILFNTQAVFLFFDFLQIQFQHFSLSLGWTL